PPSRTANEEPLTAACRRSGEGLLRARRPEPGTGWLGPARALAALRARSSGSADFAPSTVRWMRSRWNESSMTAPPLEWELPLEREGREGVRRLGAPVAGRPGGRATQWPGSGAFVDAGAAADSGEAEGPGAHARGRVVLTAGQFGRMELAVIGHRQRHPGVESLGHCLPTRTALIAGHDAAGEEFAAAARTVAEEPDALAREILIVVEQGAQTGVERSRVRIAEATVVQGARGQPRIPR